MIELEDYLGKWIDCEDVTKEVKANAIKLLSAVNLLKGYMEKQGIEFKINPKTGTNVSGEQYGGFRPQECTIGASKSAHKEGLAIDIYDPDGLIDKWLLQYSNILGQFGLYFEHPGYTKGWSHWSIKAPKSGARFFIP